MELYKILHYFGLTFAVMELIKLFPYKTALWPKITQLLLLTVMYIIIIFFIPGTGLILSVILFLVTILFTIIANNLKTNFYQRFFTCYLEQNRWPELIFILNWDFHSLALVKLKRIFTALEQNDQSSGAKGIARVNKYPGLNRYLLWHQDLLQVLHYTSHISLAKAHIRTLDLDLNNPKIPFGLAGIIMNVYLMDNDFEQAHHYFHYLQSRYPGAQHRLHNLINSLLYSAQTGSLPDFNRLLSTHPELLNNRITSYWRAILFLRCGDAQAALRLLNEFKQGLSADSAYFSHYVDKILANPGLYPPVPDSITPPPLPPLPLPSAQPAPAERKKDKALPSIILLCGLVAGITLIQFLLAAPVSIKDFILQTGINGLDFIRAGAYSYPLVKEGQWIRLLTAVFLHGNWLHLFMNLYGLFIIGRFIAGTYGSRQLFFIFLFSGFAGNLATHLFHKFPAAVGASGGVFGLLAAMVCFMIWNRKVLQKEPFTRFLVNFGVIVGINIIYGLQNPMINNTAHLAGFAGGGLVALCCLFINSRLPALKKLFDYTISISVILIFVILFSLWPALLFYDYPGKTALANREKFDGYSFLTPSTWNMDTEAGIITDLIADVNIRLIRMAIPAELKNKNGEPEFVEFLKKKLELFISQNREQWVAETALTAGEDGWYVFMFRQKQEQSPFTYKYDFLIKRFPSSICWVQSKRPEKYANQYQKLISRFVETITETDNGYDG